MEEIRQRIAAGEDAAEPLERLMVLSRVDELKWKRVAWLVLLLPLALLFIGLQRVDHTQLAFDLRLSAVRFTVREPAQFVTSLAVEELTATGLAEAHLPRSAQSDTRILGGGDEGHRLRLSKHPPRNAGEDRAGNNSADEDETSPEPAARPRAETRLELAALSLGAGTRVELRRLDPGDLRYLVSLTSPEPDPLKLILRGNFDFRFFTSAGRPGPRDTLELARPAPLTLLPQADRPLDLVFQLETPPVQPLAQHVQVEHLAVLLPRDFTADRGAGGRLVSSVLEGAIYFDDVGGRERSLRRGDVMTTEMVEGDLTFLGFDDRGRLLVRFEGKVSALELGRSRIDQMPQRFQVWNAQSPLTLYAAVLAALATLFTALRT